MRAQNKKSVGLVFANLAPLLHYMQRVPGLFARWRAGYKIAAGLVLVVFMATSLAGVLSVIDTHKAHAISTVAPDPTDFANNTAWLTLSDTKDVDGATYGAVSVYHAGGIPGGAVTLAVNLQGGIIQTGNQDAQGTGKMEYSVQGAPYSSPGIGGTGGFNIPIPVSAWRLVPGGAGYTAHVSYRLSVQSQSADDSNHLNFKMSVPGGYLIASDGGYQLAFVHNEYCVTGGGNSCAPYHNYNIPFAPDCGTNPGVSNVKIHDMDDGNNLIQPSHLKVQIIDTTSGAVVNNDNWTGSEGNGGNAFFSFNPVKDDKYEVRFTNANANNVLQVVLPFDSINAKVACPPPPPVITCSPADAKFDLTDPGDPDSIYAAVTTNSTAVAGARFNMSVTGPNGGSWPSVAAIGPSGGIIRSTAVNFTPLSAGTYTFTWSYATSGSCSKTIRIGYVPYFDVRGGDISAGLTTKSGPPGTCPAANAPKSIIRGQTDTSNWFGSGSQDAALALGGISDFVTSLNPASTPASAKAYTLPTPYGLSFANTTNTVAPNNGGDFGSFGYCADDYVADALARTGVQGGSSPFSVAGKSGTYHVSGDTTLVGSNLVAGQRLSLVVEGDVYISGNIAITGGFTAATAPYFELLVRGNIYVNSPGVSSLYGFYSAQGDGVATGKFISCSPGAIRNEDTTYANCHTTPLIIQGGLSAAEVHFDRSYGTLHGKGAPAAPAESIQFSPSLWLGASHACETDASFCPPSQAPKYESATGLAPVL